MAGKRRKWKDKLRDDCFTEKSPKKAKIQILQEDVYKEQDGKLVLLSSLDYLNNNDVVQLVEHEGVKSNDLCVPLELENQTTTPFHKHQDNNNTLLIEQDGKILYHSCEKQVVTTPVQKIKTDNITVQNLTPTFRNPEKYLAATADFLKEISPKLNEGMNHQHHPENEVIQDSILCDTKNPTNYEEGPFLNNSKNQEHTTEVVSENFSCSNTNDTVSSYTKTDHENGVKDIINTFTVDVCIESNVDEEEQLQEKKNTETTLAENKTDGALEETNNTITIMEANKTNGAILNENADEIVSIAVPESNEIVTEKEVEQKQTLRRSRRKLNFNKSYLDFIAEDDPDTLLLNEAFPSEESNLELSEVTTSSNDSDCNNSKKDKKKKKKLRKSRKHAKREQDLPETEGFEVIQVEKGKSKSKMKKENRCKRNKGEEYVNAKGETVEKKEMKPNPCAESNCINKCKNISEERRNSLFQHFWGLKCNQRRKDWIAQCAIKQSIKRPSKDATCSKSHRYEYFINEGEGRRKVCQQFLVSTLDISQRFILYTLDTLTDGFAKEDGRGKTGGHNKTSEDILEDAKKFILSLPLLPSHYCRKDSTKLYLPEEFKNITNLHRVYQAHFNNKKTMSFKVFSGWFHKNLNIGFHVPKKDKCSLCTAAKSYDCKTEEEMNKIIRHEEEKEESYKRFIFHQKLNKVDRRTVCVSFDLQKVLNTPYGESMLLYYTRKISVFNFTIYESNTQLGICNVWTEADAKRGANEIATCLLTYLKEVDKRGYVKQVILYCDSCFGQNKNKSVLAMLRFALTICENINNIQINYLIPGHSYMPVDSMHATIENSVKKSIVWAPSQWPTIMELARKNPSPYVVNVMTGKDFLGFEKIVEQTFKKNQAIQIAKISTVSFHKQHVNKMFIKTTMLPGTEAIEIQLISLNNAIPKPNLYPARLLICQKKYTDLKKMIDKKSIPERFATEYLNFKSSTKVNDCLPDTDEDDD